MAKKILLTGGCSYTDGNYLTNDKNLPQDRGGWKMWPEYLGNALDLELVNTGSSGSSNETIFHNVLEKIHLYGDRVDTVVVMWTGMDRRRIMCGYDINPLSETNIVMGRDPAHTDDQAGPFEWLDRLGMKNLSYNFFASEDFWKVRIPFIKYSIEDSLRAYVSLAEVCKLHGINFIFINALFPFDYNYLETFRNAGILKCPEGRQVNTSQADVMKIFTNNIWFTKIEKTYKKNFIGWPLFRNLGGTYFDDMRENNKKLFPKSDKYRVSEVDAHPNAEAQEIISKVILERYNKLYA